MCSNRLNIKRLVSFVFAVVFALQAYVFSGGVKAQTEVDYYENLILLQENAVKANEALNQAFGHDEKGAIQFPDDFAGVWIDGSDLVVSLIDISEENQVKYRNWAGEYAESLKFENAEYSYCELENAMNGMVNELRKSSPNIEVTQYYVSETDNEIVIGIDEGSKAAVESLPLQATGNYPVRFEIVERPSTTASRAYMNAYGGARLYNETSGAGTTLSCCGTYNGSPAILTCGHGIQQVGDKIKYSLQTGFKIGNVLYYRYQNNKSGDFGIISVETGTFDTTNIIRAVSGWDDFEDYTIKGTNSDVAVGTVVKFYGATTYYVSRGVVNNRRVTSIMEDENGVEEATILNLSMIKVTYGGCESGDSGAPIFTERSDGNVDFCGVLNGSRLDKGYLYICFTPYTYISAAGFSAKVD